MARPTPEQILTVLEEVITSTGTEWKDISAAVSIKFEIKNWLTQVRGPLQYLKNNKVIARTTDLEREIYVKLV